MFVMDLGARSASPGPAQAGEFMTTGRKWAELRRLKWARREYEVTADETERPVHYSTPVGRRRWLGPPEMQVIGLGPTSGPRSQTQSGGGRLEIKSKAPTALFIARPPNPAPAIHNESSTGRAPYWPPKYYFSGQWRPHHLEMITSARK